MELRPDSGTPSYERQQPSAKSNSNRTIIIVVAVVLGLCICGGLAFTVGPIVILTLLGPTIGDTFEDITCALYVESTSSSGATSECAAYIQELEENYSDDLDECRSQSSENYSAYQCLDDRGLGLDDIP